MEEIRVVIPEEVYAILTWEDEDLPAVCVVNQALANFPAKKVFAWHLSIIVELEDVGEQGMPSPDEKAVIDQMTEEFHASIKADGNALYLAHTTWNGTRQILYRVYDPEIANDFLMGIVEAETQIRHFDFRMDHDEEWELADYFLEKFER